MWAIIGEVFFLLGVGVLLLGGFVLTFVNLPGVWLIWLGILLTAIVRGLVEILLWFLIVTFILAIVVSLIDNFVIPIAAKKYGGGKWGMIGGIAGLILGLALFNVVGLFIGPFLGAFTLEYLVAKKERNDAFRAGMGSFLGVIASIALKVTICFGMIVAFLLIWIF